MREGGGMEVEGGGGGMEVEGGGGVACRLSEGGGA